MNSITPRNKKQEIEMKLHYLESLKVKQLLVLINVITILVAPMAYIPLAKIQAAYLNRCFLYTTIAIEKPVGNSSYLHKPGSFKFFSEASEWGSIETCDQITFGLVSLQIMAFITTWCILQLWGEMMAHGKGGAMAMILCVVYLLTTVYCLYSCHTYDNGFQVLCDSISNIKLGRFKLTCQNWNNEIEFEEIKNMDVIYFMKLAKEIKFALMFVEAAKVLTCFSVYFVTVNQIRKMREKEPRRPGRAIRILTGQGKTETS